jgi:hypothetical protein
VPAAALGIGRVLLLVGRWPPADIGAGLEAIETLSLVYLAVCLLGGLAVMVRALTRLRSVTARRQLRWIVWGSSLGALPFVALYLLPFLFVRTGSNCVTDLHQRMVARQRKAQSPAVPLSHPPIGRRAAIR